METPGYHHVSPWFPLWKLDDFMWFPPKENALRSGFRDSLAWKPGGNLGFPTWKPGENYKETTGFQRETLGKPHGYTNLSYANHFQKSDWKTTRDLGASKHPYEL